MAWWHQMNRRGFLAAIIGGLPQGDAEENHLLRERDVERAQPANRNGLWNRFVTDCRLADLHLTRLCAELKRHEREPSVTTIAMVKAVSLAYRYQQRTVKSLRELARYIGAKT